MAVREDGVVVDDTAFDWGTRFRPDPDRSPVEHLGGMPAVIPNIPPDKTGRPWPDPNKSPVVPPGNVNQERAVQLLIDKVFSDKEKEELFTEENLGLVPPKQTEEEARESREADEKATTDREKDDNKAATLDDVPPASTGHTAKTSTKAK
jgi:hypothetical protein